MQNVDSGLQKEEERIENSRDDAPRKSIVLLEEELARARQVLRAQDRLILDARNRLDRARNIISPLKSSRILRLLGPLGKRLQRQIHGLNQIIDAPLETSATLALAGNATSGGAPPSPAVLSRSIALFKADPMPHTPFACLSRPIAGLAVHEVEDPARADIIVARSLGALHAFSHFRARFLVWTHEPRLNVTRARFISDPAFKEPVAAMNAHNGEIYKNPFYYFPRKTPSADEIISKFKQKSKAAVVLATFRKRYELLIDDRNIDFCSLRQQYTAYMYKRALVDVYGRDWPKSIRTVGESRIGQWKQKKQGILDQYRFNLCLESTDIRYYITEKLWDALLAGCMPIYYGANNGIYEVIPKESVLELSDYEGPGDLVEHIEGLKAGEIEERVHLGIKALKAMPRRFDLRAAKAAAKSAIRVRLKSLMERDYH